MAHSPAREGQRKLAHATVRLIATTDLHGRLRSHDYLTGSDVRRPSLETLAAQIGEHRDAAPNTILLDNGDTFEGDPLVEIAACPENGAALPHPMVQAMNALGYTAATLGNHDFDFGLDVIKRIASEANFPIALSNVAFDCPEIGVQQVALIELSVTTDEGTQRPLKLGVAGVLPETLVDWEWRDLAGARPIADMVTAAKAALIKLRAAGADLCVLLAHTGLDARAAPADDQVIAALADLGLADAIVAGHTHTVFPMPSHPAEPERTAPGGVPIVQPGHRASHLGLVELDLRETVSGGWQVVGSTSWTEAARPAPPKPAIVNLTRAAHVRTQTAMSQVLAHLTAPISTFFCRIGPCPALTLLADAQRDCAERHLEGHPLQGLPVISMVAPPRSGGTDGKSDFTTIAPGAFEMRHIFDLCPYENRLVVLCATGRQVADWLSVSARTFKRLEADEDEMPELISGEVPGYAFDVAFGLTYDFDISVNPGAAVTVQNIRHNGRLITPSDRFLVVTNTFRAGAGGGIATAKEADIALRTDLNMRRILADYVAKQGLVTPRRDQVWRFAPGGREVQIDIAAPAAEETATLDALGMTAIGGAGPGFARFVMTI